VETTNYRTAKLPTDVEVPEYIGDADNFATVYRTVFDRAVARDGGTVVYQEYAWPLSQPCDPCAAQPPSANEFAALGATWLPAVVNGYHGGSLEQGFLTRLHVRYDAARFPEDLVFQETKDTEPWQIRLVVNHRFTGNTACKAGRAYEDELAGRQQREVANLVRLTGWSAAEIRKFVPRR
jgi:hypothetical protein